MLLQRLFVNLKILLNGLMRNFLLILIEKNQRPMILKGQKLF